MLRPEVAETMGPDTIVSRGLSEVPPFDFFSQHKKVAQKGVRKMGRWPHHTWAVNPSTRLVCGLRCYRTTISSSQRVEARFESFARFIFHGRSPMPSEAAKTLPFP